MAAPAVSRDKLAELLRTGQFSDLTLICQGNRFCLHKFVVCPQSPVIAALLQKTSKDQQTSVLHITDFDPATVECMAEFLYHERYSINIANLPKASANACALPANVTPNTAVNGKLVVTAQPRNGSLPPGMLRQLLLCHVQVNAIGHHYKLPKLCQESLTYIRIMLRNSSSLTVFSDIAVAAYKSSCDEKLHELVSSFANEHLRELLNTPSFEKLGIIAFRLLETSAAKLQASQDQLKEVKTQSMQGPTKEEEKLVATQAKLDSLKQQVRALIAERERLSRNHELETKKSAGDDEKFLALRAEVESLKLQVKTLTTQRETLSRNHDLEKMKAAVLVTQRNNHKDLLDAEKEKMESLNDELTWLRQQVASITTERDEFFKSYEAEKKEAKAVVNRHDSLDQSLRASKEKAAALKTERDSLEASLDIEQKKVATSIVERNKLQQALDAEIKKVNQWSAHCNKIKQTLAAEKEKAATAVSERDSLQKSYASEKDKAANMLAERDTLRRERNQQGKNTSETLTKINDIVKLSTTTSECRNCRAEFACWIEDIGIKYVLRCDYCSCRHEQRS